MQNRFTPRKSPSTFRPPTRLSRGGAFRPNQEPERPLTGKVKDLKASDDEERLSRTLEKGIKKGIVRDYEFRWTSARRGSIFYKEMDFKITLTNGTLVPIMLVENSFVHRGAGAKEKDKLNEIHLLQKLQELGYNVREIIKVPNEQISTQEKADKVGRKLGIYR